MADVVLEITVPEDKVDVALEGFLALYPNSEVVSEEDPTPKYTNKQWILEKLKRVLVRDIHRGLQKKANQEAQIPIDDEIVN